MTDRKALTAWLRQHLPSLQALGPDALPLDAAETLAKIAHVLEDAVPMAEHDRRVAELLAANNDLVFRLQRLGERRDRGERRRPPPSHRHYKGGYYRLLGALWAEGSAEIMIRYAYCRSGREWVRPAHEFLGLVAGVASGRRYEPIERETREIDSLPAPVTLFEYRLLANASLVEKGAPAELVQQYGREQWAEAWRDGVDPQEAAISELAERRAA